MEYYYTTKKTSWKLDGKLRLKVCGMNRNTADVASLRPDYLGFIFWKPSKRYFTRAMPEIPHSIKKVGVFVDAPIKRIDEKVQEYNLLLVQLHGQESPEFCKELKGKIRHAEIIKAFSMENSFDFGQLEAYEEVCDYYLFDTKGRLPGGTGLTFDWSVLKNYPSTKPYFLSGGIGLGELESIKEFIKRPESKYCHALDVNSRFEIEPGLKDIEDLKRFKGGLKSSSFP